MSKVYVYSLRWEHERTVDKPQVIADEWLVDVLEVERAMRTLKPINHRYIVEESELYKSVGRIVQAKEDDIIDELGDSLDKDDERTIQLQADLHTYQVQNQQARASLSDRDSQLKQLDSDYHKLKTDNRTLQEQVEAQTNQLSQQRTQITDLEGTVFASQRRVGELEGALKQLEQVLTSTTTTPPTITQPKSPKFAQTVVDGSEVSYKTGGKTGEGISVSTAVEVTKQVKGSKGVAKGSVPWGKLLRAPNFPLRNDIRTKKVFHAQELSSKLSNSTVSITEADIDYIANTVFKGLGYIKEKPNSKLFTTQEAILIIVATYTKLEANLTGLAKLEYTIQYLFDDWYANIELIKDAIGVK